MDRGVALVTGASRGLGLEASAALVARGFLVYASMRDPSQAEAVREAVAARGFDPERRLRISTLDVCDADAVADHSRALLDRHGAVDVLVNNAGVASVGFGEELDEAELRRLLEINFIGAAHLTRRLVPAMRERRAGRIINVSSIGGRVATPAHAAYHASKFALEGWAESLRHELLPFNVFVVLVEPGLHPTGIFGTGYRRCGPSMATGRGPYARLARELDAGAARASRALAWAEPREVGERIAKLALAEAPRLRHVVGLDAWISAALGTRAMAWLWDQTTLAWSRR